MLEPLSPADLIDQARELPRIAGFEIVAELGRGGMGVVYQARQLEFDRHVAIKMILTGRGASAVQLARFRIEAEAIACLDHPNIVRIHKIGVHEGCPYCALEFADGGNLAARSVDGVRSPRQTAELVRDLAQAMQMAHDRGILHRDLKPANVLLTADGTPKITDFGLAKFERPMHQVREEYATFSVDPRDLVPLHDNQPNGTDTHAVDDLTILQYWRETMGHPAVASDLTIIRDYVSTARQQALEEPTADRVLELTRAGDIMGSPQYMAPEQAYGRHDLIGPRTDIYGLGTVLYYLLAGHAPFSGGHPWEVVQNVRHKPPLPLGPHVTCELKAICRRCLEKDAAARYSTAAELAEDLQRFLDGCATIAGTDEEDLASERNFASELDLSQTADYEPLPLATGHRRMSRWKRGLVGAAAGMGLIALMWGLSLSSPVPPAPGVVLRMAALMGVVGVIGGIVGSMAE